MLVSATIKQVSFIRSLADERGVTGIDYANLSMADASELITKLLAMPKSGASSRPAVTNVGMYQTADGAIYRVKRGRDSWKLYAMRLDTAFDFVYEAGAMRKLSSLDKMTLEQAKAFGVATGFCCACGLMLTDPVSVERGIGPVCLKNFQ